MISDHNNNNNRVDQTTIQHPGHRVRNIRRVSQKSQIPRLVFAFAFAPAQEVALAALEAVVHRAAA